MRGALGSPGSHRKQNSCSDSATSDGDAEQAGVRTWNLGDGTRPASMTTADTLSMLKQVLGWMSNGYNDCGLPAGYSPYAVANAYQGGTTYESDMTNSGGVTTCGDGSTDGRDHESVVDFGNLDYYSGTDGTPLGLTCKWTMPHPFNKNNILEADVRINTTNFTWFYAKPSSCTGQKYDLRAVIMHEFGHVYGLNHVSESAHGNLTMSTITDPCDISGRTLGKGDLISLQNTYS